MYLFVIVFIHSFICYCLYCSYPYFEKFLVSSQHCDIKSEDALIVTLRARQGYMCNILIYHEEYRSKYPMPCVVFGCNNTANKTESIAVHKIPFFSDNRPECVKRHKIWVDFVSRRRAHWAPTKNWVICPLHFKREDFVCMFTNLPGQSVSLQPQLQCDELGPCVYPTIQTNSPEYNRTQAEQLDRTRRKVSLLELSNVLSS